jgi:hypothetical protein
MFIRMYELERSLSRQCGFRHESKNLWPSKICLYGSIHAHETCPTEELPAEQDTPSISVLRSCHEEAGNAACDLVFSII